MTPRYPNVPGSYIEGWIEVEGEHPFVRYVNGNGAWVEPHRIKKQEKK